MRIIHAPLFRNFTEDEYEKFLTFTQTQQYKKGELLFERNSPPQYIFILLEGKTCLEKTDINGKRSILNQFQKPGTMMGEVFAFLQLKYDFDLVCETDSKVMLVKRERLIHFPDDALQRKILQNLVLILSEKSLFLNRKNQIVSSYSLRQKIANYIFQYKEEKSVLLTMTRQEWADYLGTTRPSLSRELSKMENEKILSIQGNKIQVLDEEQLNELL